MSWVLILLISAYGSDGGNAISTAQFATRELCDAAGREAWAMVEEAGYRKKLLYRCVASKLPTTGP